MPLLPLGSGCATPALQAQVNRLEKKLGEIAAKNDQTQQKQDDLENRVFLLSDQVESQKVAQSRRGAPELPVVALRPPVKRETAAPHEAADLVEFSGPAHSDAPDKVRPLLRAEGDYYAESMAQSVVAAPSIAPRASHKNSVTLKRSEPVRSDGDEEPAPAGGALSEAIPARAEAPAAGGEGRVLLAHDLRQGHEPRAARRRQAAPLAVIPPSGDNLGVVPVPRVGAPRPALAAAPPGAAQAPDFTPEPATGPTLTPARPGGSLPALGAGERAPVAGEPIALYRIAYDRLRAGHYEEAERDMREFVRRFPRHDYADNAQYWLGETFYARKTYGEAATAFRAVVERWPSGNKAPDALLKLGYSLLMLGERDKGKGVLSQVLDHYPRTDAARLAEKRLGDLKEGLKEDLKEGP